MTDQPPLLCEVFPAFSAELISLLNNEGHTELAICTYDLGIIELCSCEDGFCRSFYTAPRPDGAYGPGHANIALDTDHGMIVLDVVDGRIMFVEVLYFPPLR